MQVEINKIRGQQMKIEASQLDDSLQNPFKQEKGMKLDEIQLLRSAA